jgi:flagellar protein FlaG
MKIDTSGASNYSNNNSQSTIHVEKVKVVPTNVQVKSTEVKPVQVNYTDLVHKPQQELSVDEKNWIELIEKANKAIIGANKTFEYSIHEKTKQIMVKVINSETKELIREIPPEKILDMVARMWELSGIMIDERR